MKTTLRLPKITIIFPNFNGGKEPLECLASISKLNYPKKKIETIVVDNGSTDGSDLKIRKKFPWVKLIKNKQNLGFAKGVNIGIKNAKGKYIFIANDDLVFEKNSLKKLVEFAQNHKKIGVLGGKIFYKHRPTKIASTGYFLNKWTGDVRSGKGVNKITQPDWVQGCAMLVPKKILTEVGLLDEGYAHLFEDVDFCFRVKKTGYDIVYLPTAKFWHGEGTTADKNKPQKYYGWYSGKFRFFLKNMPTVNIVSVFLIQILAVTPYRTLILRDGRFWPFVKGLIWNFKNFNKTITLR